MGKHGLFNKGGQSNWISTCRKMSSNLRTAPQINSTWTADVNVSAQAINLSDKHAVQNLDDLGLGEVFLDSTSKAQSIKEKIGSIRLHQN